MLETITKNGADTSSWKHEASGILVPKDSATLRFFPPDHIFNAKADSLMPAWSFFVSLLSDSLAYVTEYYNELGVGGRKHMGIDIAGRQGTRILAPFSGKAWTTLDERGGIVIALVNEKSVLLFMHCDQLLYLDGQDVFAGDPLATVGMTGHTTGPHVHFAVGLIEANGPMRAGPVRFRTINPVQWVFQYKPKN
jgi:murein DD-endopeptidase MepM/ murein hydrolase activator NlpD